MTAYSSSLNLRMKDLYTKNYYTPQLPMRTFRNPYFLPTSNQLLFDILKKQSATTASTPTRSAPPTPSTARSSSVPPSTTAPKAPKRPAVPADEVAAAAAAKAAKEQDRFNKNIIQNKKDIAARNAAKAAAAKQGGKTKAGGGKIAAKVFSPPPTFIPNESLDSKLSKMESWKQSQPPSPQLTTTDKQSADLMLGFKILKDLKKQKAAKKLSEKGKGAASKPIEKAGKEGDTTKLTDAAKPRFKAGSVPKTTNFPKLTSKQLTTLAALYKSWKSDANEITNAESANPKMTRSVKDKIRFVVNTQNAIKEVKKQIVALENKGR